jgi:iron complex outermembrane receptor protein
MSGLLALDGNTGSEGFSAFSDNVATLGRSALHVGGGGVNSAATRIPSGTYTDPGSGAAFPLDEIPQSFDRSSQEMAGYSYQGARGSIGAGFRHYHMNYGIPGVPPNPAWDSVPPTTSQIVQDRNTVELRGLLQTGGAFVDRVRLNAAYNDYGHSEFPTAQDSSGVSAPQANHFHKREFNGVVQLDQRPAGRLTGTLGLWTDVQDLEISGDQPLGPDSRTTGLAGYAYEEYAAGASTLLQAGVRFDYDRIQTRPDPASTDSVFRTSDESRLSNAVTASVGLLHRLSPHLSASLSAARSFRAPTVQELFADGLDAPSGTYTVGTASLGPEHGYGLDASLKGAFAGATFELSPYLNFVDGYIYGFLRGDTIQNFPVRQFGATDARLMGFEASATVAAGRSVVLEGSADYVNAEDTRQHVPLPFTPPLRGTLRASWEGMKGWGLVEWRFAASQTRLGDGDTPTDGYAVLDLGLGVRVGGRGSASEVGLYCDNVLNTVYRDNLSVIKDFLPQPGRAFRLTYQLTY